MSSGVHVRDEDPLRGRRVGDVWRSDPHSTGKSGTQVRSVGRREVTGHFLFSTEKDNSRFFVFSKRGLGILYREVYSNRSQSIVRRRSPPHKVTVLPRKLSHYKSSVGVHRDVEPKLPLLPFGLDTPNTVPSTVDSHTGCVLSRLGQDLGRS